MVGKRTRIAATVLAIGTLSACGAGGSGTPASSSRGGSVGAQTLPVSVSLFVPNAIVQRTAASRANTSASLKPLYLPSSINSVTIQQTTSGGSVVRGAPITVLVIGGPNCTAGAGGQTCSVTLQGALGQDAWSIKSFISGDGTGPAISLNTGTLVVLSGAANVLTLTLNPILAALTFVPVGDSANATTTSTLPLVLEARDPAGAIIVGPGAFVTAANVPNPITVSSSSASHIVLETTGGSAASGTVSTPTTNDLAQLAYDGTLVAGTQTVTASASGISTATFNLTLTLSAGGLSVPASISLGADLGTTSTPLAISEPGYGGSFTLTSSSCAGVVTFPGTAGPGPSTSPTVTQVGGGTCTILISDGINSGSVTVYSTTIGIVLQ